MVDEVLLMLSAAWPTVLSTCIVLASLVLWRRAATAHPGTRRHAKPPRVVREESRQGSELPQWRGVRHRGVVQLASNPGRPKPSARGLITAPREIWRNYGRYKAGLLSSQL